MSRGWRAWKRPLRDVALIAILLAGVSFLPPDTSLRDRQGPGTLRYCVADKTSPLITQPETGAAGPERALLEKAAAGLGLRVILVEVANMRRSFNPSDWNITRGQCDVIGGGLADTPVNRGFLTLLPTGEESGLALIGPQAEPPKGSRVGIYVGTTGFDRVALSRFLRAQGWQAEPLRDEAALRAWLGEGQSAIASRHLPRPEGMALHALPEAGAQGSKLALGLWRGDMTLTRALRRELAQVAQ